MALRMGLEALKFVLLLGILAMALAVVGPTQAPPQTSSQVTPDTHMMECWPGDDVSVPGTWDYCPNGYLKDV